LAFLKVNFNSTYCVSLDVLVLSLRHLTFVAILPFLAMLFRYADALESSIQSLVSAKVGAENERINIRLASIDVVFFNIDSSLWLYGIVLDQVAPIVHEYYAGFTHTKLYR